jgi:hypothetical protein
VIVPLALGVDIAFDRPISRHDLRHGLEALETYDRGEQMVEIDFDARELVTGQAMAAKPAPGANDLLRRPQQRYGHGVPRRNNQGRGWPT